MLRILSGSVFASDGSSAMRFTVLTRVAMALPLLLVAAPVWAEDITVTTYYPSPRGMYDELRAKGDVNVGDLGAPPSRLHVAQADATRPALRVDTVAVPGQPALFVAPNGNVGIRTSNPLVPLHVFGEVDASAFRAYESNGVYAFMERGFDGDGVVQMGAFRQAPPSFAPLQVDAIPLILQQRSGGNVGLGTPGLPAVDLAIRDDDTGFELMGDNDLAAFTGGQPRLRVTDGGLTVLSNPNGPFELSVQGGVSVSQGLPAPCPPPDNQGGLAFQEQCYDTGVFSGADGEIVLYANSDPSVYVYNHPPARVTIDPHYPVGIGFTSAEVPTERLEVKGNVRVEGNVAITGAFVDNGTPLNVPDQVFAPDYRLMPLPDVAAFINTERHLPGIPAAEDQAGWAGLSLQERDMKLLEKIEELTVHVIRQEKRIGQLEAALAGPRAPGAREEAER